jgi:hypothetical protein
MVMATATMKASQWGSSMVSTAKCRLPALTRSRATETNPKTMTIFALRDPGSFLRICSGNEHHAIRSAD